MANPEKLVIIEHENGRRYQVTESTYSKAKQSHLDDQTFESAGYKIVSYADGTAYEKGKEPTRYALHHAGVAPEIGETEKEGSGTPVVAEARPAGMPVAEYAADVAKNTAMDVHEEPQSEERPASRRKGE